MNRTNLTSRIITGAALFLTLMAPHRVSAVCNADSSRWAWQHPAYAGLAWQRSADSLIADIPDALCGNAVKQVRFTGTKNLAYAVVQLTSGLQVSTVEYFGRIGRCDIPLIAFNTPLPIPQTSGIGSWYLYRQSTTAIDTLLLVIADATPRVFVRHLKSADNSLLKTDTLTLSNPPAGAAVSGITGTSEVAGQADAGIIIFGTRGLLRRFNRTGSSWQTEQVYDIANTQNVTAACDSFAATASGRIYRRTGASFALQSTPVSVALQAITRNAAVGDNGAIVIRSGTGTWTAHTSGSASYRKFNLTKFPSGSTIELLDSAWRYSSYTYSNTATRISALSPSTMGSYLNGPIYSYSEQRPETLTIALNDPDSNFAIPAIVYNGNSDLRIKGSITLEDAQPALACNAGTAQLAEGRLQILMKPDSVILLAPAYIGTFDPSCLWNYWSRQTFRNGERWNTTGQVTIKLPQDSVRIRFNTVTATTSRKTSGNPGIVTLLRSGAGLCLMLSQPTPHAIRSVRIFNPAGQILAHMNPSNQTTRIVLHPAAASSMLYVQLIMTDGTVRSMPLPIVK